jgi:hypothetical protein
MHAKQIIERYEAKEVVFHHSALLINVRGSAGERDSIYEAVRYAWKLDPKRRAKRNSCSPSIRVWSSASSLRTGGWL